jgi:ABC-type glycerol-3-phosphate transport system permease component
MGMEDDSREFFARILNSIAVVLIWMILCVFLGIYKNYGFFDTAPNWKNYLFYFFFIAGLLFVIRYLYKKWKP